MGGSQGAPSKPSASQQVQEHTPGHFLLNSAGTEGEGGVLFARLGLWPLSEPHRAVGYSCMLSNKV